MTNPFLAPWVGWDDNSKDKGNQGSGNPFLDQFESIMKDQIHQAVHQPFTDAMSSALVNEMVNQGMIDSKTGKQILPAVTLIVDKIDPCG